MAIKKKVLFLALAGLLGLGIGGASIGLAVNEAQALETVTIGSVADFNSVFNGSAESTNKNITFTSDIDASGISFAAVKMAGEYTGTLDGGGHTIYGITTAGNSLVHFLTGGTIKDLTLEATVTGSASRVLCYQNNGAIENCRVIINLPNAVNSVGPFSYLAGTGTYTDCTTHFVFGNASSNTISALFHEGSNEHVTNCAFTKNGENVTVDGKGATEVTNTCYVTTSRTAEVNTGASANISATLYGATYTSIAWSLAGGTTYATLSNNTTATVSVTGVAAGSDTLTATVISEAGTFTASCALTVVASSDVTAITLDKSSDSIYAGATSSLTATLTGTEYTSLTWTSVTESVATVDGSGLSATVTGVKAGSAVITVTVVSGAGSFTDTCDITVTAAVTFDIYFFVPQSFNWTTESAVFYGGGITETSVPMTKAPVAARFADATNENAITDFDIYSATVNASVLGMVGKTGVYVQAGNGQNPGRWGSGYSVDSYTNGFALYLPNAGSGALTSLAVATSDIDAAVAYMEDIQDQGYWRDSGSICWLIDGSHKTELDYVLDQYAALSENAKYVLSVVIDDAGTYKSTWGDTINYLSIENGGGSGARISDVVLDNNAWIILIVVSGTIVAAGAFFFLLKKKKRA